MSSHAQQAQVSIIRNFVGRSQALGWICFFLDTDPKRGLDPKSVLRIRKFLGLPGPGALVRGPDPDPSNIKQK